jgi:type I restriction enzyme S subunit
LYIRSGSGGTPKSGNPEYYGGSIPFLSISDIPSSDGHVSTTKKALTETGLRSSAAWIVPAGSLSLAMYASVGRLAILDVDMATSQAFFNMSFDPDTYRDFIYNYLQYFNRANKWKALISTGTQPNLNAGKVSSLIIEVPEIREIGEVNRFFKNLNSLIAAHERKLGLLKKKKTYYLQQIFSQKLRFRGFIKPWKQRKLGDITQRVRSYSLSRAVETTIDTGYRYIHYGDIHTGKAGKITDARSLPAIRSDEYDLLVSGDLIYADASEDVKDIAKPAVLLSAVGCSVVAGLHTIALRPTRDNSLFLFYCSISPIFREQVWRKANGLKVIGISAAHLQDTYISLPENDEEEKVGNFFKTLDSLIAAHEKKLNLLKKQKQAYLQKIFV